MAFDKLRLDQQDANREFEDDFTMTSITWFTKSSALISVKKDIDIVMWIIIVFSWVIANTPIQQSVISSFLEFQPCR